MRRTEMTDIGAPNSRRNLHVLFLQYEDEQSICMRAQRLNGCLAIAALFVSAVAAQCAEFTAHWTNPGNGNWSNPANWDVGLVPNNGAGNVFNDVWDAKPVTIPLDVPVTISN